MELAAGILIGSLALVSGGVWILALWRLVTGRPLLPRYEHARTAWSPAGLVLAGLWIVPSLIGRLLTPGEPAPDVTLGGVVRQTLLLYGVYLVLLLLVLRSDRPAAFGLRGNGWRRQLADGAVGFLACWLPVLLAAKATEPLRSLERQHSYLRLLRADERWETVLVIAAAAAIVAPLLEELMFRVVLQGGLSRWLPRRVALGIAAVVFCVVHGWPDMLPLLPLALVLGYVYDQRHSYLAVVVLHALFNLTMLAAQLLTLPGPGSVGAALCGGPFLG